MDRQPDDFALAIGIQHYPEYRSLQGSIADAEAFANWLTIDPLGGGLPKANCKLIVSGPNPPPVPVKDQVDDAVDQITRASSKGARRFYFYFSGHGMTTDYLDLALCMATWSRGRSRAALSYNGYFDFFLALGNFREVVFLLDCCRVREIAVGGYGPENSVIVPKAGGVSTFAAFAAEIGSAAYEAQLAEEDAAGQPNGPRGHFSQALMEALRGGASGPERGVTAARLEDHLKKRTPEIAALHKHNQSARVRPDIRAGVQMIFGDYPSACNVILEFDPPRPGPLTLLDPHADAIKTGSGDAGAWHIYLPVGLYCLLEGVREKYFRVRGGTEVQHERL